MISLSLPQWYGLGTSGLVALLLLTRATIWLIRILVSRFCFIFLKYVVYRAVSAQILRTFPWQHLIFLSIYLGANVFCTCFRVGGQQQIASRSGVLASINLIPLLLGTRFSAAADILGLSLRDWSRIHSTVSVVSIIQSAVHVALNAGLDKLQWTTNQIFGVVVGHVKRA